MKKALKITGLTLLILVVVAAASPYLFKKKIIALVKKELNNNLNATSDFRDLSISLFRHFPNVSVKLEDLFIIGKDEFSQDTLVSSGALDASINLFSFISGDQMKVNGIYLESPRIHALVNKDGRANWDIAVAPADTAVAADTAGSFHINLKKYGIRDGYIYYRDETANMSAEIVNLNHSGSGDLTQDLFTLETETHADAVSFTYAGIPYLAGVKADIQTDIGADMANSKYSFSNAEFDINNLKLKSSGFFQLVNDSVYAMDITYDAPTVDFKDILSLVPAVYKNDFGKLKTEGKALFNGFIKGTYSNSQLPAYLVNLDIQNGFFQYPDLPKPVRNIQVSMKAENPDGQPDHAVVEISKGHIEMDKDPFDFKLLFRNPETAKYIDAAIKGRIDLGDVSKFVKLEEGTKLAGLLDADVYAKGNMKAMETGQGDFNAGGFFNISNLYYASKDFPQPIRNGNIKARIDNSGGIADNTNVDISSGHIELGSDPFDFTLKLSRPMTDMNFDGSAKGRFTLDNVRQFTQLEEGSSVAGLLTAGLQFAGNKSMIDKGEYDRIQMNGTVGVDKLKYTSKDYPSGIAISKSSLSFNPKNVTLDNLEGNYLQTRFSAAGSLDNLVGYALGKQSLEGVVNVSADKIDLNQWMGTESASATETDSASGPFLVPSDINLLLHAKAEQVIYDKVNYNNVAGSLAIRDETVYLQDLSTNTLDGNMKLSGSYSTRLNKKDPAISLTYDVNKLSIQKTFLAFNTVQALMPIGKFLDGDLSSELTMTGSLKGDMMPDLSTLSGNGNLLLIDGILNKFKPLEKLASTLSISELQQVSLKDVRTYIEFANGKVLVKPFTVKVKDIEMQIGGMHGLDQSIDYIVQMKIPRKYLGEKGNTLVNGLAQQATSKGIPVKLGDVVNLNVKLGGTIGDPTVKTDLKDVAGDAAQDMKEQAAEFAQQKIDSTKQTLKDSLNVVKKQLANDAKDEVRKQLFGVKDSSNTDSSGQGSRPDPKKNTEQTIKNTLKGILNRNKKEKKDSTR